MQAIPLAKVLSCPNLPSLPSVAVEILELASVRDVAIEQIARVIQNDPALAARILKTVNSSFYGLSTPCPTISRALTYLGLNTVKSIVLGFSLVEWTRAAESGKLTEFWSRSLHCAAVSRRLANLTTRADAEEAFLAALLQDIGLLALRCAIDSANRAKFEQQHRDHQSLCDFCQQAFGLDHAQIGAALARKWRLPGELAQAIADHHCAITDLPSRSRLSHIVSIANHIVTAITSDDAPQRLNDLRETVCKLLAIDHRQFNELMSQVSDDVGEISRLLAVDAGEAPDIDAILSQAEELRMHHQLAIVRHAEELAQTNNDLRRQTLTDPLTGIGNRKHFDQQIAQQLNDAQSNRATLALLMIDVDHFKALNDAHGHQTGDAVLTELARRLSDTVGRLGVTCRYGGEEFAIIMPNVSRAQAASAAQDVCSAVAKSPFIARGSNAKVPVTVSIGVAIHEPSSKLEWNEPATLTHAADTALFAAKQSGRNAVRIANALKQSSSAR
jgi:two-component system, cell cycle response regulator